MRNEGWTGDGGFADDDMVRDLQYHYVMKNFTTSQQEIERDPRRQLEIQDPVRYRGQLGIQRSDYWFNCDRVFIVNGFINKADENFDGPFLCSVLGATGLAVGSYPAADIDTMQLYQAGITAVLSLSTVAD